jgi:hypothetical protein
MMPPDSQSVREGQPKVRPFSICMESIVRSAAAEQNNTERLWRSAGIGAAM